MEHFKGDPALPCAPAGPPRLHTGWAQIHGLRGDTDIAERIRYDIWYIENWTVALDIKIIFHTPCSAARWSTTKNYNNALCVTGRECL